MRLSSLVVVSTLALSLNVSAGVSDQSTDTVDTDKAAVFIPSVDDIEIGATVLGDTKLTGLESQFGDNKKRYTPPEDDIEIGAAIFE